MIERREFISLLGGAAAAMAAGGRRATGGGAGGRVSRARIAERGASRGIPARPKAGGLCLGRERDGRPPAYTPEMSLVGREKMAVPLSDQARSSSATRSI